MVPLAGHVRSAVDGRALVHVLGGVVILEVKARLEADSGQTVIPIGAVRFGRECLPDRTRTSVGGYTTHTVRAVRVQARGADRTEGESITACPKGITICKLVVIPGRGETHPVRVDRAQMIELHIVPASCKRGGYHSVTPIIRGAVKLIWNVDIVRVRVRAVCQPDIYRARFIAIVTAP